MAKIKIRDGVNKQSLTPFHPDVEHVTTSDFGSVFPTFCMEVVPGDKINMEYSQFTRLSPLAVPTFGRASVVSRAFFVPNTALFPQWRKWIVNDYETSDLINYPSMNNDVIVKEFLNPQNQLSEQVVQNNFYLRRVPSDMDFADGYERYVVVDSFGRVVVAPWILAAASSTQSPSGTIAKVDASTTYVAYALISSTSVSVTTLMTNSTDPLAQSLINEFGQSKFQMLQPRAGSLSIVGWSFVKASGNSTAFSLSWASESSTSADVINFSTGDIGLYVAAANFSQPLFVSSQGSGNSFTSSLVPFDSLLFNLKAYDIADPLATNSNSFYKFTAKGRLMVKIFAGLGYRINWTTSDTTDMSLLPLLAFFRCMYDYLFPSNFVRSLNVAGLFDDFKEWNTDHDVFSAMLKLVFAPLSADFFTLAWQSANSVQNRGQSSSIVEVDVPGTDAVAGSNSDDSYLNLKDNTRGDSVLTSYGLRMLQAISDFVIRNNIAGSRYFEQMRARFGLKGSNIDPDKSRFLDSWTDDISISDVTATNGTSTQLLGEQAGKGISAGNNHRLHFDNSNGDYGWLVVITQIVPKTGICQGRLRHTLKTNYLEYFTPEFEKVGLQPIRQDELYADFNSSQAFADGYNYGGNPSGVFGFSHRFFDYKRNGISMISGDFMFSSRNVGMEAYHLMRVLPPPSQANPLALNLNFMSVQQKDYDRIFSQVVDADGNEFDHFFQWFFFKVDAYRPMLSIGEAMPIENGSGVESLDYEGVHLTS